MNRIIAAALVAVALPLGACGTEDPTGAAANQDPVANAGEDVSRVDVDGDGHEEILLNGSDSRDVDGSIAEYTWLEKGEPIASGVDPSYSFAVGTHEVTLIVMDDRGATASDVVRIVVQALDLSDPPTVPLANTSPTARITMPCNGLQSYEGRGMYFGGQGLDAEDGRLPNGVFEWTYDGQPVPDCHEPWNGLYSACADGGWIERIELGPHVLTLTVEDSEGATDSASITMTGVAFENASFTDDILSFLLYHCESCHGAERAERGIRLDSYEAIMTGGDGHGLLIVEGDPTGGILIPQILSDHLYVDGHGLHMSQWMGETILPVWILEGARNTDHEHPPYPLPRCGEDTESAVDFDSEYSLTGVWHGGSWAFEQYWDLTLELVDAEGAISGSWTDWRSSGRLTGTRIGGGLELTFEGRGEYDTRLSGDLEGPDRIQGTVWPGLVYSVRLERD